MKLACRHGNNDTEYSNAIWKKRRARGVDCISSNKKGKVPKADEDDLVSGFLLLFRPEVCMVLMTLSVDVLAFGP